jgi:hypothetical protein
MTNPIIPDWTLPVTTTPLAPVTHFPKTVAVKEEAVKVEPTYARILREHGYMESNIPLNSEYWRIRP